MNQINDSYVFDNWGEFDFIPMGNRERYIAVHAFRIGREAAEKINTKADQDMCEALNMGDGSYHP